jgi:hypothetical protein
MAHLPVSRDERNAGPPGRHTGKDSILKPEPGPLTDLNRHEIIMELEKQLDEYGNLWLKSTPRDKDLLLTHIRGSSHPFSMLCFLAKKINDQTYDERAIKFKKKLKKWTKEFHAKSGI